MRHWHAVRHLQEARGGANAALPSGDTHPGDAPGSMHAKTQRPVA